MHVKAGIAFVQDAQARLRVSETIAAQPVPTEYLTDWTYAATLATPKGKDELLEYYEKNAPMGRCSMDTGPIRFAREQADKCFAAGDLPCFLQLQVKIMGDQFQRVAYPSYGERSHPAESRALEATGIDVERRAVPAGYQYVDGIVGGGIEHCCNSKPCSSPSGFAAITPTAGGPITDTWIHTDMWSANGGHNSWSGNISPSVRGSNAW